MTTIAVCVFAIGGEYKQFYERYFKPSHERYCKKYGYDLLVLDKYIDTQTERHLSDYLTYQKILVANYPSVQDYDYVLILDADIYILQTAGPLSELVELCGNKIGAVNEAIDPSRPIREEINRYKQWPIQPNDYYNSILPKKEFQTDILVNTGLMFIQPRLHKHFYEELNRVYGEYQYKHPSGAHFEGAIIGYEIQKQNLLEVIDNKWNCIFLVHAENSHQNLMEPEFFYDTFLKRYWFIHFCAKQFLDIAEFFEASGF